NAFRLLRDCYQRMQDLGLRAPDAPLATVDQAFDPLDYLFLADRVETEGKLAWRPWLIDLPDNDDLPGGATHVPGSFEMFLRSLAMLREFIASGDLAREAERSGGGPALEQLRAAHGLVHAHAQTLPPDPRDHAPAASSLLIGHIEAAQDVVVGLQTPE